MRMKRDTHISELSLLRHDLASTKLTNNHHSSTQLSLCKKSVPKSHLFLVTGQLPYENYVLTRPVCLDVHRNGPFNGTPLHTGKSSQCLVDKAEAESGAWLRVARTWLRM